MSESVPDLKERLRTVGSVREPTTRDLPPESTVRLGLTTPTPLTAESEEFLADLDMYLTVGIAGTSVVRDRLAAIEAAAIARHVRETGCEGGSTDDHEVCEQEARRLRRVVKRVAYMGLCSQTHHESIVTAARAALASPESPASGAEGGCPCPLPHGDDLEDAQPETAPAASPEVRGGGCDGTCMGWASPGPCPACVEPYQPATASAAARSEEGGE